MKQRNTIFLISKIRENANKFILADLAQHGITNLAPSHGDILACLYQKERVTMKEIADAIHRTKPTVTVLVNKLAELGLVRKAQAAEDSRVIYAEGFSGYDAGRNKKTGKLFAENSCQFRIKNLNK